MTEEELEARLNETHHSGIAEGLRRAGAYTMDAAKDSFERFGTEERQTVRLRALATELYAQASAATSDATAIGASRKSG